jgi:hypothetical protein
MPGAAVGWPGSAATAAAADVGLTLVWCIPGTMPRPGTPHRGARLGGIPGAL